jgi:hypothetical protein
MREPLSTAQTRLVRASWNPLFLNKSQACIATKPNCGLQLKAGSRKLTGLRSVINWLHLRGIARPHGRARIETPRTTTPKPCRKCASPDLTVGRGLKHKSRDPRTCNPCIARPHGRARIETSPAKIHQTVKFCIARPHGRARIETRDSKYSRTGCTCIARPHGRARIETRDKLPCSCQPRKHRPTSRSGAD